MSSVSNYYTTSISVLAMELAVLYDKHDKSPKYILPWNRDLTLQRKITEIEEAMMLLYRIGKHENDV